MIIDLIASLFCRPIHQAKPIQFPFSTPDPSSPYEIVVNRCSLITKDQNDQNAPNESDDNDDHNDGIHPEYQRRIYLLVKPPLVYPLGHHHDVGEKIQARVSVQVYLKMGKNIHRDVFHFHFSKNIVHSV